MKVSIDKLKEKAKAEAAKMPKTATGTYRSGFDIGYGLAWEHVLRLIKDLERQERKILKSRLAK